MPLITPAVSGRPQKRSRILAICFASWQHSRRWQNPSVWRKPFRALIPDAFVQSFPAAQRRVLGSRLVGLWRMMAGFRWIYLLATVSLDVTALSRTGNFLLL